MKQYLVTFDDSKNTEEPQVVLRALPGVVEVTSVSVDNFDSKDISNPGAALTPDAIEKIAFAMESDLDFLSEQEAEIYLSQLKSGWNKTTP